MAAAAILAELDRATWGAAGFPIPAVTEISPKLLAWLRERLGEPGLEYAAPLERLPAGTDTHTYRFRLTRSPGAPGRPLVLRLYAPAHGAGRAVRESRVQHAIARTGFPAPDVHFLCTDPLVLGGAFFIMDFLPGEGLFATRPETIPAVFAGAHLRLHGLDPDPVVARLRAQGEPVEPLRPDAELARLAAYARRYPSLEPVLEWMAGNLPAPAVRPSLCHGDFHPLNIAVEAGEVTGVFDWPDFMVGDPVADVAKTLVLGIPARHLFPPSVRHRIWERYLDLYRREAPFDFGALGYYSVRSCLIALLAGAGSRTMWRHPAIARGLLDEIRARTGVELAKAPWDEGSSVDQSPAR